MMEPGFKQDASGSSVLPEPIDSREREASSISTTQQDTSQMVTSPSYEAETEERQNSIDSNVTMATTQSSRSTSSSSGSNRPHYAHPKRRRPLKMVPWAGGVQRCGGTNLFGTHDTTTSSEDSSHMSVQSQTSLETGDSLLFGAMGYSETSSNTPGGGLCGITEASSELIIPPCQDAMALKPSKGIENDGVPYHYYTQENPTEALSKGAHLSSQQQKLRQDAFAATRRQYKPPHDHPKLSPAPKSLGPYDIIRTVGRGNFAVVKLAIHRELKAKVAVKVINKEILGGENLEKVYREIEAMKRLDHPHIIQLYQVIETDKKIFMVLEYAERGEVFDLISASHAFTERDARELFWQCICAVHYCHKSGVVHRDLKAENLLLDAQGRIKVADFGFCNFFQPDAFLSTHCGSPQYAAPELFKGESYDGTLADVWSLGVVLYILVCGSFPFPGDSLGDIRRQVLRGLVRFPFFLSRSCEIVIRGMLQVDPKKRLRLEQVIETPWMLQSTSVEQYQELMKNYMRDAHERRFHDLFRTYNPNETANILDFITNSDAQLTFLSEQLDNALVVRPYELLLPSLTEKGSLSSYMESSHYRLVTRITLSDILNALQHMGLDGSRVRLSLIYEVFDQHYAAFHILKEKVKRYCIAAFVFLGSEGISSHESGVSVESAATTKTQVPYDSSTCATIGNNDGAGSTDITGCSSNNKPKKILPLVLRIAKQDDSRRSGNYFTFPHPAPGSTTFSTKPSPLLLSGDVIHAQGSSIISRHPSVRRAAESVDETDRSHLPYGNSRQHITQLRHFFRTLFEDASDNVDAVSESTKAVPMSIDEDEALFQCATQEQSLRRHTVQLEIGQKAKLSSVPLWSVMTSGDKVICESPEYENLPVAAPTESPLHHQHCESSKSVQYTSHEESSSSPSWSSKAPPSWLVEDVSSYGIQTQEAIRLGFAGQRQPPMSSIDENAPTTSTSQVEPKSVAVSHTNENAWCLLRCLPHLNLPASVSVMQHQPLARFTIKDPNLLAPPHFMTPSSSRFPRRSSDGGAEKQNLHKGAPGVGGSYPEQSTVPKFKTGSSGSSGNSSNSNIRQFCGRPPLDALLCALPPPTGREIYQKRYSLPYAVGTLNAPDRNAVPGMYKHPERKIGATYSRYAAFSHSQHHASSCDPYPTVPRRGSQESQISMWSQRAMRSWVRNSPYDSHDLIEEETSLCSSPCSFSLSHTLQSHSFDHTTSTEINVTEHSPSGTEREHDSSSPTDKRSPSEQSSLYHRTDIIATPFRRRMSPSPSFVGSTRVSPIGKLDLQLLKQELKLLTEDSGRSTGLPYHRIALHDTTSSVNHYVNESEDNISEDMLNNYMLTQPQKQFWSEEQAVQQQIIEYFHRMLPEFNEETDVSQPSDSNVDSQPISTSSLLHEPPSPGRRLHLDFLDSPKRQSYFDWFPRVDMQPPPSMNVQSTNVVRKTSPGDISSHSLSINTSQTDTSQLSAYPAESLSTDLSSGGVNLNLNSLFYLPTYHSPAQRDEDEADLLAIEKVNEKLRRGELQLPVPGSLPSSLHPPSDPINYPRS